MLFLSSLWHIGGGNLTLFSAVRLLSLYHTFFITSFVLYIVVGMSWLTLESFVDSFSSILSNLFLGWKAEVGAHMVEELKFIIDTALIPIYYPKVAPS